MQKPNLHQHHSTNEWLNNPSSNPSKWDTFTHRAKDAVGKTLLSTTMVAGLWSMPSWAMSALTDETRDQIATVVNSDNNQLDNEVMDYILEAKRSDISTINKVQEYSPMQISYLTPADILPIVWQIEAWDKKAYEHIEHLRIAEATKVRDMMWEYGAWDYDAEEYKEKMGRLNTGMIWEKPTWYTNYELVWWGTLSWSNHAHIERSILNEILNQDHVNFKVISTRTTPRHESASTLCIDPNKINIFWSSMDLDLSNFDYAWFEPITECDKKQNRLMFSACWNIWEQSWISQYKIYQKNLNITDNNSVYNSGSRTHGKNDVTLDKHCLITVWTNKNGNVNHDPNDERINGSKFPVWFHDKVLFSWRIFPYHDDSNWKIVASSWNYASSYPNYVNVAMTDLCFQMRANVADVDELLDKIRDTALTDYIRLDLNGDGDTDDVISMATDDGSIDQPESQPLQLINPAWFFNKYNLPDSLPSNVASNEAIPLEKWYYKGVIFNIPGAEVYINGEWIAVNNSNSSLIKSQNPFHLNQWRINGNLLRELWYNEWETITWTIQAVDDEWNGLQGLNKEFSVQLTAINGIDTLEADDNVSADDSWYSIDGKRLPDRPTTHGIYIHNGKKVVVK